MRLVYMCMKRCPACDRWLDPGAFSPNRSRPDGLQAYCHNCQRSYVRGHYEANRDYYIAKAKKSRPLFTKRMKEFLAACKSVPCTDCGGVFPPYVMHFDHIGNDKLINVSSAVKIGRRRLLAEAAKCEIVCANCHRQRTHDRLLASGDSAR